MIMTSLLAAALVLGGGNNDGRNENGRDCYQASARCSDDDSVTIAPVVCVEPGACRFDDGTEGDSEQ